MRDSAWVSLNVATALLGVPRDAIKRLANRGAIGVRQLPGENVEYCRADIERLRDESVRPAGSVTAG